MGKGSYQLLPDDVSKKVSFRGNHFMVSLVLEPSRSNMVVRSIFTGDNALIEIIAVMIGHLYR